MKNEPDKIRKYVNNLATKKCPVCRGEDMEGDTNIYKLVSPFGSSYEYVVIRCLGCDFMRFHRVSSSIRTENQVVRSPINYSEKK